MSDRPSELDALVARTAGPQPWRKAFHAFNAVALCLAVALLDPPWLVVVLALAALVAALLVMDWVRLRDARLNELFFRSFGSFASPREARGVASSTWYALGLLVAFTAFPRAVAISSALVLGLCDPAAGYLGRRFGRRPFLGGTMEGSLVFFAVAFTIVAIRHAWPAALAAATVAMLAERRSWPLDDNLAIPLVTGGAILLVEWIA